MGEVGEAKEPCSELIGTCPDALSGAGECRIRAGRLRGVAGNSRIECKRGPGLPALLGMWALGLLLIPGLSSAAGNEPASHSILPGGQLSATPLSAPAWTLLSPKAHPPFVPGASMVYDARDQAVMWVGGGATWEFSGGNWTAITASAPIRNWASLAYDAKDGYPLFYAGNGVVSGTWKFANSAWSAIATSTAPPPRQNAGMTYDAQDGYVVLFGGYNGNRTFNDTWTYSGGKWTNITTSIAPPASASYTDHLVFDARDRAVLCYGEGFAKRGAQGTWMFAAGKWTHVTTSASPSAVRAFGLSYDKARYHAILYGGSPSPYGCAFGFCLQTWEYANGTWTLVHIRGPGALEWPQMAFDVKDGYLILFGGYDRSGSHTDTWKFV